jgi:acyl-CoA thioesterase I
MKLLLWLVLVSLSASAAAERQLLVLGDSLSAGYGIDPRAGWVNLLGQRLRRSGAGWEVVNASISGDTSAGGLARLPGLLERCRPHLVIIELGSNDGLRGLGFEQLRDNLARMVAAARRAGAAVLLVGARVPPNYGQAYAEHFHRIFHQVAAEQGVPLVSFLLQGVAQDRSMMQADGYHPLAVAQPRLLDNVWPLLEPLLAAAGGATRPTPGKVE